MVFNPMNESEEVFLKRLLLIKEMTGDDEIQIDENLIELVMEEEIQQELFLQTIYENYFSKLDIIDFIAYLLMLLKEFNNEHFKTDEKSILKLKNLLKSNQKYFKKSSFFQLHNPIMFSTNEIKQLIEKMIKINDNKTNIIDELLSQSDFQIYTKEHPSVYSLLYFYIKKVLLDISDHDSASLFDTINKKEEYIETFKKIDTFLLKESKRLNTLIGLFNYSSTFEKILNDEEKPLMERFSYEENIFDKINRKKLVEKIINNSETIINEALTNNSLKEKISQTIKGNHIENILKTIKEIELEKLLPEMSEEFKETLNFQLEQYQQIKD